MNTKISLSQVQTRQAEAEATQVQTEAKARPLVPTETEPVAPEEKNYRADCI
jgi:hypothetical protein